MVNINIDTAEYSVTLTCGNKKELRQVAEKSLDFIEPRLIEEPPLTTNETLLVDFLVNIVPHLGDRIPAIKAIRCLKPDWDLKRAKDFVDDTVLLKKLQFKDSLRPF